MLADSAAYPIAGLDDAHALTGLGKDSRRLQACDAGSHHQHIELLGHGPLE
jgi:hypothetical protein